MINYGLENKVVLLTGGSRGLGRILVDELKQQGCVVILLTVMQSWVHRLQQKPAPNMYRWI